MSDLQRYPLNFCLIKGLLLSRQRFKGYCCESDMTLYKWKVTRNDAYSPLNDPSLHGETLQNILKRLISDRFTDNFLLFNLLVKTKENLMIFKQMSYKNFRVSIYPPPPRGVFRIYSSGGGGA